MPLQPLVVLACQPDAAAAASEFCSAGSSLVRQTVYVQLAQTDAFSVEYAQYAALSFSIVMSFWLVAKCLGVLLSFVQRA